MKLKSPSPFAHERSSWRIPTKDKTNHYVVQERCMNLDKVPFRLVTCSCGWVATFPDNTTDDNVEAIHHRDTVGRDKTPETAPGTPTIQSPPPEPPPPPPPSPSQPGLSPRQKAEKFLGGLVFRDPSHPLRVLTLSRDLRLTLLDGITTLLQQQSNEDEERHRQARARLRSLANGQAAFKLDCITRYIELCIQQGVARATEVNLSAILAIIWHKFDQSQIDAAEHPKETQK